MAKMIPSTGPRAHVAASREGYIYHALSLLPDDYYVVHSFGSVSTRGGSYVEREADFVVFHPDLGILCVEAKAGAARCQGGVWYYGSGEMMSREGPYRQASGAKYRIMKCFDERGLGALVDRCKFMHAVWFVSLTREEFSGFSLPPDASRDITLFLDDLRNPEPAIRRIFSIDMYGRETRLSHSEAQDVVQRVLCPEFIESHIVSSFFTAGLPRRIKCIVHRLGVGGCDLCFILCLGFLRSLLPCRDGVRGKHAGSKMHLPSSAEEDPAVSGCRDVERFRILDQFIREALFDRFLACQVSGVAHHVRKHCGGKPRLTGVGCDDRLIILVVLSGQFIQLVGIVAAKEE